MAEGFFDVAAIKIAFDDDPELRAVEPVGQYAVKLVFDDGHDTGIFSWDYLYELGAQQAQRWAAYLEALAARLGVFALARGQVQ